MLTNQQILAVNHHRGPALILAVPGAGKTTVLIYRTANLIENHGVDPRRILSITFSKASALDMEARFKKTFPGLEKVKFSTIHSFCYSLVLAYARQNRINYRLIENSSEKINKYSILREIHQRVNQASISEDSMENLLNSVGYVKNMMISPDKIKLKDISNFSQIYRLYEDLKQEHNYIDFDDMLLLSYRILRSNPESLAHYQALYDFIQVDEAQDTSILQMEIIKLLALPKNNLFIVADDDQSIYGFRGAYPDGLLSFKSDFQGAKVFLMEENFRSTENIVTASKVLIAKNMKRFKKDIYTSNSLKDPVKLIKLDSLEDQYDHIISEIKENPLASHAILYRNNISAIGLINELDKNSIDFNIPDKNLKFFNHWVLRDIKNFMDLAQDPSRLDIYEKIYYKMKGYISKKQLEYAARLDPSSSVFSRISSYPDIKPFYLKTLASLEGDFKRLNKLTPKEALSFIRYDLAYLDYLKEFSDKFGYSFSNLSLILKFLELIADQLESREDFFQRIEYLRVKCLNSGKSKVSLSTIHSAKGLEFDQVYMIDLVDGDFPSATSIDEADNKDDFKLLEEERRLFYVAMTRAKHRLTMFSIDRVDSSQVASSRFIKDLTRKE